MQQKPVMIQTQNSQGQRAIPEERFATAVVELKVALDKKDDNVFKVILSSFNPEVRAELLHRLDVRDFQFFKEFKRAISYKNVKFAECLLNSESAERKYVMIIKGSKYMTVDNCPEIFELSMKELTSVQKNDLVLYNCTGNWMRSFRDRPEILRVLLNCALPYPRQKFIQKLLESLQPSPLFSSIHELYSGFISLSTEASTIVSGYTDPTIIEKTEKLIKEIVFTRGALKQISKGPCVLKTLPKVEFAHICTFLGIIDFAFPPAVQIPANIILSKAQEVAENRNIISEEKLVQRL